MKKFQPITMLATVMAIIVGVAVSGAFFILYDTAFNEKRDSLIQTAKSHARLIEAAAESDAGFSPSGLPKGAVADSISKITKAHAKYRRFGETGEFLLGRRKGDKIVFVLRHRQRDLEKPGPVLFASNLAEPMRRALLGQSGTVVGPDFLGVAVLAAYEPVPILGLGIVAKIDISEVRAPFIRAGTVVAIISILLVLVGTGLFLLVSGPMIRRLQENEALLKAIIKCSPGAVVIRDPEGKNLFANEIFGEWYKVTRTK